MHVAPILPLILRRSRAAITRCFTVALFSPFIALWLSIPGGGKGISRERSERQESEAKAVTIQNLETEQFNLNASLDTMINSGISQYTGMKYGGEFLLTVR